MKISAVKIENLRGLESVSFESKSKAIVIVGPNATGKTTILESIRLIKSLLMPSYFNEATEVLQLMNVRSQHLQTINLPALMRDPKKMTRIDLTIDLSDDEIRYVDSHLDDLAARRLKSRLGASQGQGADLALIQLLSTKQGLDMLAGIKEKEISPEYTQIKTSKQIRPGLIIENRSSGIRGTRAIDQEIVSLLDQENLPTESLLSYFPADRAMPSGEVNIQIGANDSAAQLKTHIAHPNTKYSRLKQYIVNQFVRSEEERKQLVEDFKIIFENLLPGKSLEALRVSKAGSLNVMIKEPKTGYSYDIDNMSSGEKGLILTFLLMKRNIAKGGIILVDEPELHLNPAVCKKIMPFMLEHILNQEDKQAIICTHSPEILGFAFEHSECSLMHLRSSTDISPILKKDKEEVYEALKRLGTDQSDVLFSKGTLFVEGPEDVDLIDVGFSDVVAGFKVKALGGRSEVEKEILVLQENEKKGLLDTCHAFLFDRDKIICKLSSTEKVKVKQWERYCIENYLLDPEILFDVMKDALQDQGTLGSRGDFSKRLKDLSGTVLRKTIALEKYHARFPPELGRV